MKTMYYFGRLKNKQSRFYNYFNQQYPSITPIFIHHVVSSMELVLLIPEKKDIKLIWKRFRNPNTNKYCTAILIKFCDFGKISKIKTNWKIKYIDMTSARYDIFYSSQTILVTPETDEKMIECLIKLANCELMVPPSEFIHGGGVIYSP